MTKDHVKEMLDRVLTWPPEAQREAVESLARIAAEMRPESGAVGEQLKALSDSHECAREELQTLLESVRSWTQEDQEHLVEIAREIEAIRKGSCVTMTDEEWEEVQEGLAQAERGEFVLDEEMEAFWKKIGVL